MLPPAPVRTRRAEGQLSAPTVRPAAEPPESDSPPPVQVTIGLVEVRTAPAAAKPAPASAPPDRPRPIRLADYLARREGGGR